MRDVFYDEASSTGLPRLLLTVAVGVADKHLTGSYNVPQLARYQLSDLDKSAMQKWRWIGFVTNFSFVLGNIELTKQQRENNFRGFKMHFSHPIKRIYLRKT